MKLISNISLMFNETPLSSRLGAARQAGFDGVEIQFPACSEIDQIKAEATKFGMPITLINVPRGPGDAVGLAALPGMQGAFREAVAICAKQAVALGVRKVNILSGRPPKEASHADCLAALRDNLIHAADVMTDIGVEVLVEPVNRGDVPGFFLSGLETAIALLEDINHPNLGLQFDFYHMAITEPDLPAAIRRAGAQIRHVQFADTPGRHQPGTGTIDFRAAFAALHDTGYNAEISAEYKPQGKTSDGLEWMADFKRMMQ